MIPQYYIKYDYDTELGQTTSAIGGYAISFRQTTEPYIEKAIDELYNKLIQDFDFDKIFGNVNYYDYIISWIEYCYKNNVSYDDLKKHIIYVLDCYNRILYRNPDIVGFNYWIWKLLKDSKTDVYTQMKLSDEYLNIVKPLQDFIYSQAQWITTQDEINNKVYDNVFYDYLKRIRSGQISFENLKTTFQNIIDRYKIIFLSAPTITYVYNYTNKILDENLTLEQVQELMLDDYYKLHPEQKDQQQQIDSKTISIKIAEILVKNYNYIDKNFVDYWTQKVVNNVLSITDLETHIKTIDNYLTNYLGEKRKKYILNEYINELSYYIQIKVNGKTYADIEFLIKDSYEYQELKRIEYEHYPPEDIQPDTPEYWYYYCVYNSFISFDFGFKEYISKMKEKGVSQLSAWNIYNKWLDEQKKKANVYVISDDAFKKTSEYCDDIIQKLKKHIDILKQDLYFISNKQYDKVQYKDEYYIDILKIINPLYNFWNLPEFNNQYNIKKKEFLYNKLTPVVNEYYSYVNKIFDYYKIKDTLISLQKGEQTQQMIITGILLLFSILYFGTNIQDLSDNLFNIHNSISDKPQTTQTTETTQTQTTKKEGINWVPVAITVGTVLLVI